jgi:hypothetical protein
MTDMATAAYVAAANRYRMMRDEGSERGLTTTEVAVLTFVLVGVALAIGWAIFEYSKETVSNFEEPTAPQIGD